MIAALRRWVSRLANALRPDRAEDGLTREITTHLTLLEDDFRRRGLSPEEAHAAARRAFGGVEHTKDCHRDARSFVWFDEARWDVRYAIRSLARSPLFALTAVLSLAIGLGADIAVFTIVNALLLRSPAAVAAPDCLVDISGTEGNAFGVHQISFPNFADVRNRATTLEDMYGYEPFSEPMSLAGADGAERIFGHKVTTSYFAVLGVHPAIGRLFDTRPAAQAAAEQTVVLSHRFWTRRFNADPAVVGQSVMLNGVLLTVVGVAPAGFEGTSLVATDVWAPLSTGVDPTSYLAQRGLGWALVRARLKPGVSVTQAAAEIDTIGRTLEQQHPDENRGKGLRLAAASFIPGNLALPLAGIAALVTGFVSLVLVIACANLAGLLLARATARRREIAVRVAIGAGRARLMRQLLTETMLLFVVAGGAGLWVARGLATIIRSFLPLLPVPLELSLALDGRTIAFSIGLSFVAAALCGLAPALQASKPDVISTLKDETVGIASRSRLRNAFVVGQVALSIVLVAGTGVFARALQRAASIDPGFDPRNVELASLDLSLAHYTAPAGQQFLAELTERVRGIPGVVEATAAANLPTGGPSRYGTLTYPGSQPSGRSQGLPFEWNVVQPRYFATMRIPLVAGRDFTDADNAGAQPVIIVNEEAARRYWPGENPIGKTLLRHPAVLRRGQDNSPRRVTVIGVVRQVATGFREAPRAQVYLLLHQEYVPRIFVAARTTDGQRRAAEIHQLVRSMNRNLPIMNAQTLEEAAAFTLFPRQVSVAVSGGLGLVGLLLATMGVYSVTAYAAALRTREIGIRLALGATRAAIISMVLGFGMRLMTIGAVAGLALAATVNAVLTGVLPGFPPPEVFAFGGAAFLFAVVGIAACYLPVRRATEVDPVIVLRSE